MISKERIISLLTLLEYYRSLRCSKCIYEPLCFDEFGMNIEFIENNCRTEMKILVKHYVELYRALGYSPYIEVEPEDIVKGLKALIKIKPESKQLANMLLKSLVAKHVL